MAREFKSAIVQFLCVVGLIVTLSFAISRTQSEDWLTLWLLLFIFLGIPLLLLAIRDFVQLIAPDWLGARTLLLHVCAAFAALLGYGLGWMADVSGHPKAELNRLLVVIFPAMVYAVPVLMTLHGFSWREAKTFYRGTDDDNESRD